MLVMLAHISSCEIRVCNSLIDTCYMPIILLLFQSKAGSSGGKLLARPMWPHLCIRYRISAGNFCKAQIFAFEWQFTKIYTHENYPLCTRHTHIRVYAYAGGYNYNYVSLYMVTFLLWILLLCMPSPKGLVSTTLCPTAIKDANDAKLASCGCGISGAYSQNHENFVLA